MELKDCFVIMPFSSSATHTEEKWTEIFENFFVPAWSEFEIECHKTNVSRGSITKDIIEKLYSASIVFADLTDSNPNVMYELGVRHTFQKPSIMVKQKGTKIPFDVNDYNVFEYEYTPKGLEDLKNHIKNVTDDINQYPNKSDNPVWDFLYASDFVINYTKDLENIQKLEAIKEEFENNLECCNQFLDKIEGFDLPKNDNEIGKVIADDKVTRFMEEFFPNIQSDALNHLRITRYVDFSDQQKEILNEINNYYRWCCFYSSNLGSYELDETEKQKVTNLKDLIPEGISIINKRVLELEVK